MYVTIYKNLIYPFYESVIRGRKTITYLKEFEKNQWRPENELREIQWKKMKAMIEHAYKNVPYYRESWKAHGFHPSQLQAPIDVHRIPLLNKQDIQTHNKALLAENYADQPLYSSWTGGSTGQPLHFKYDHHTYETRVASTARIDRWAGWEFGAKEFLIWGIRPDKDPWFRKLKKRIHLALLRRHVISSYTLSEQTMPKYVKEYNAFKPRVIIAYTGSLYTFAQYIKRNNLKVYSPKGIIATAEQIYPHQRALIEEVFQTKVFNRYGSREFMNIGMECDKHEGLHLNIENLYVEVLVNGRPAEPGETGEIVVTDLNNFAMPFIRYRTQDLGAPGDRPCSCGRGMPLLQDLSGRRIDMIKTRDGKSITGLFFTHLMLNGVDQYQIVQKKYEKLVIKIVPNRAYGEEDRDRIKTAIQKLVGDNVEIQFEIVTEIPKQASGKTRITISEVDA